MRTLAELQAETDRTMRDGSLLGAQILLQSAELLAKVPANTVRFAMLRAAAGVVGASMAEQGVSPEVFDVSLTLSSKAFEQMARDAFLKHRYPPQPAKVRP